VAYADIIPATLACGGPRRNNISEIVTSAALWRTKSKLGGLYQNGYQ